MESKFCTVTRYDRELYKAVLKQEGWKLNLFRRFSMTTCILLIAMLALIQTVVFAGRDGSLSVDHARMFFIFAGIMVIVAFILEWKTSEKRVEKALEAKAGQRLRQSGKPDGVKEAIYWYEDYCVIEGEEVTSRYAYTGLRKVEEGETYLFLTFGGKTVVFADKDGFRKGKPEKFKRFLEGKLKGTSLDK